MEGSPPRMRERLLSIRAKIITPKDHPRVCGKDLIFDILFPAFWGSPPRMRERLQDLRRGLLVGGITPAYAGKTL